MVGGEVRCEDQMSSSGLSLSKAIVDKTLLVIWSMRRMKSF